MFGTLPAIPVGRSDVVVQVLGSSDLVSILPDGTIGESALGQCRLTVAVDADAAPVDLLVTFARVDGATFATSCTIERR